MEPTRHSADADKEAIDALVTDFFSAFNSTDGGPADVRRIYALAVPLAVFTKAVGSTPESCTLGGFVEPRHALLNNGTLTDFSETELSERTEISGNVAQRHSVYRKTGMLAGERFTTLGVKTFQFVRLPSGWRLTALSWDDEREGFRVTT